MSRKRKLSIDDSDLSESDSGESIFEPSNIEDWSDTQYSGILPIRSNLSDDNHSDKDEDDENDTDGSHRGTDIIVSHGLLTPARSTVSSKSIPKNIPTWSSFRASSIHPSLFSGEKPDVPIPESIWINVEKFWIEMCKNDGLSAFCRNPLLFEQQSQIVPRMRAVLFEWISEVADAYNLERDTFYRTLDYIDRYLTLIPNVPKSQLQLIGITCLFIASKVEEIYPPNIGFFSSVTDGACTEDEIFAMELVIVQHLNWRLSPSTINQWIEMFLQFIYKSSGKCRSSNLLEPSFSGMVLKRLFRLIDLFFMDESSLRFSYGTIATTAIYILVDPEIALRISGLKFELIEECVQVMSIYQQLVDFEYPEEKIDVNNLPVPTTNFFGSDNPRKQKHTINFHLYELARNKLESLASSSRVNTTIDTPPSSTKKLVLPRRGLN